MKGNAEDWDRLQKLTQKKCFECKTKSRTRCCDKFFCRATRNEMSAEVRNLYPYNASQALPYMGKSGCIVPAVHRPFCASYVCPQHFKDERFKAEYLAVSQKAFGRKPPMLMMEMHKELPV